MKRPLSQNFLSISLIFNIPGADIDASEFPDSA